MTTPHVLITQSQRRALTRALATFYPDTADAGSDVSILLSAYFGVFANEVTQEQAAELLQYLQEWTTTPQACERLTRQHFRSLFSAFSRAAQSDDFESVALAVETHLEEHRGDWEAARFYLYLMHPPSRCAARVGLGGVR